MCPEHLLQDAETDIGREQESTEKGRQKGARREGREEGRRCRRKGGMGLEGWACSEPKLLVRAQSAHSSLEFPPV